MTTITIKHCLDRAKELGVPVIGDVKFRGDCKVEDSELADFHQKVTFNYPQYADLAFHVPNEFTADKSKGGAKFAHMAKRKNKGVKDGMCDYVVLPIRLSAPVFLCEMKRRDISESIKNKKQKLHFLQQIELLASQKQHGAVVCVALGCDSAYQEFIKYVEEWGC